MGQDQLQEARVHHEEVEPVEEADEVALEEEEDDEEEDEEEADLEAEGVHLEEHLQGEEDDEEQVGQVLERPLGGRKQIEKDKKS